MKTSSGCYRSSKKIRNFDAKTKNMVMSIWNLSTPPKAFNAMKSIAHGTHDQQRGINI